MGRLSCGWLVMGLSWVGSWLAMPGLAQIVQDGTLGVEASQVFLDVFPSVDLVVGGARRGDNLFHSFEKFEIAAGRAGYFVVDDLAIQNILARVTGTEQSEIFGTLGTRAFIGGNFQVSPANLLSQHASPKLPTFSGRL